MTAATGPGAAPGLAAALRGGPEDRPLRQVVSDLVAIVGRARTIKRSVAVFVGLAFGTSFVQMLALMSFQAGFARVGAIDEAGQTSTPALVAWIGDGTLGGLSGVVPFLAAFLLFSLAAAALDHLGWIVRLRLLSRFEANQVVRGLRAALRVDPRERAEVPRRELIFAVRGDCKSMRLVFQMALLVGVSFVQISWPLAYLLTLDAPLALLGLGIVLLAFVPVALLGRESADMALERQRLGIEVGSQVSGFLEEVARSPAAGGRRRSGAHLRSEIDSQQALWRRQYTIRSLCQKAPTVAALLATYVILLIGVFQIGDGSLGWSELMTFVIASRVVFQPFTAVGGRFAKTAENLPRARRHLAFVAGARDARRREREKRSLRPAAADARTALTIADLALPTPDGLPQPPLDLALARGDVLAIVDPGISFDNPLAERLVGDRYAGDARVSLDGQPLDELRHRSLKRSFAFPNEADGPPAAALADLRAGGAAVAVVDFFRVVDPERRAALLQALQAQRDAWITLWLDTTVRPELGAQRVAVFEGGLYRGTGDRAWFDRTFPHWNHSIPPSDAGGDARAAQLGALEALEDELLEEEGS